MTDENNNENAPSSLSLLPEMITSPSSALDKIWRFGAPWWLPFLIVLVSTALVWVLYYTQLDYEWFIDLNTAQLSGDERAQAIEGMSSMSKQTLMGITLVSIAVMLSLFCLLSALYLLMINRVTGTEARSYKQWLSIVTWTATPSIFIAVGSLLSIVMSSGGQIAPEALSLTNLNNLVFHASREESLFGFYNSIDLISLWGVALIMMALMKNGQSKAASFIVALVPQLIISGIALL